MTLFFNLELICQPFNPYTHGAEIEPGSRLVYLPVRLELISTVTCQQDLKIKFAAPIRILKLF